MSKQDIEKALEILKGFQFETPETKYEMARIIAIQCMELQLNNGWIPCKERLPEVRRHKCGELIEFNIMLQGGVVPTTGCINNDDTWGWMDWSNFRFNPIGVDVIAWQPLPEPYEEESK